MKLGNVIKKLGFVAIGLLVVIIAVIAIIQQPAEKTQPSSDNSHVASPTVDERNWARLVIEVPGENAVEKELYIYEGDTAYDMLANSGLSFSHKEFSFGKQVTGINGINQTDDMFWIYYVNDQQATVGADGYVLQPEDVITWKLEENIYK